MNHCASKVVALVLLLFHPEGQVFAFQIKPMSTNNQVENEAILKGFQLLQEVKAESIEIFGDSQLVINQLISLYECKDDILKKITKRFPPYFSPAYFKSTESRSQSTSSKCIKLSGDSRNT
jgi:ribonuclease HI